uniref:Cyclic nucleotide-binding domain-containing protein n=1 Tax=Tanacetum cinerariifolium TaxID=118510 RepID=A0A699GIW2_TANCI
MVLAPWVSLVLDRHGEEVTTSRPGQLVDPEQVAGIGDLRFLGQVLAFEGKRDVVSVTVLELGVEEAGFLRKIRIARDVVGARVVTVAVVVGHARVDLAQVIPQRGVVAVLRQAGVRQHRAVERVDTLGAGRVLVGHAGVIDVAAKAAQPAWQEGERGARGQFQALGGGALAVDSLRDVELFAGLEQVHAADDLLFQDVARDILLEQAKAQLAVGARIVFEAQVRVRGAERLQVRIAGRAIVGAVAAEGLVAAVADAVRIGHQQVDAGTRHHLGQAEAHHELLRDGPGHQVKAGQVVVVLVVHAGDAVGQHPVHVAIGAGLAGQADRVRLRSRRFHLGARVAHAHVAPDLVACQFGVEVHAQVRGAHFFVDHVGGNLRVHIAVVPEGAVHVVEVEVRRVEIRHRGAVHGRHEVRRDVGDLVVAAEEGAGRRAAHRVDQCLHFGAVHVLARVIAVDETRVVGPAHGAGVIRIVVDGLVDIGAAYQDVVRAAFQVVAVAGQVAAAVVALGRRFAPLHAAPQLGEEWRGQAVFQVQFELVFRVLGFVRPVLQLRLHVRAGIVRRIPGREVEVRQALRVERHFQARRVLGQHDAVGLVVIGGARAAGQAVDFQRAALVIEAGGGVVGVDLELEVARGRAEGALPALPRDVVAAARGVAGDVMVFHRDAARRGRGGHGKTGAGRRLRAIGAEHGGGARIGQARDRGEIGAVVTVVQALVLAIGLVADKCLHLVAHLVLRRQFGRRALVVAGPDAVTGRAGRVVVPLLVAGGDLGGGQVRIVGAAGGRTDGGHCRIERRDGFLGRVIPVAQEAPRGVARKIAAGAHVVVDDVGHHAQAALQVLVGDQQAAARLHAAPAVGVFAGQRCGDREFLEVERLARGDHHGAAHAALGQVRGAALVHVDRADQLRRQLAQLGAAARIAIGAQHRHAVDLHPVQVRLHAADRHLRALAEVARELHARDARQRLAHVLVGELVDVFRHQRIGNRRIADLAVDGRRHRFARAHHGDHAGWRDVVRRARHGLRRRRRRWCRRRRRRWCRRRRRRGIGGLRCCAAAGQGGQRGDGGSDGNNAGAPGGVAKAGLIRWCHDGLRMSWPLAGPCVYDQLVIAFYDQALPTIAARELERMERFGVRACYRDGEMMFEAGSRALGTFGMFVVLRGKIRISRYDGLGNSSVITEHGPGEFAGEMSQLSDAPTLVNGHARGMRSGVGCSPQSCAPARAAGVADQYRHAPQGARPPPRRAGARAVRALHAAVAGLAAGRVPGRQRAEKSHAGGPWTAPGHPARARLGPGVGRDRGGRRTGGTGHGCLCGVRGPVGAGAGNACLRRPGRRQRAHRKLPGFSHRDLGPRIGWPRLRAVQEVRRGDGHSGAGRSADLRYRAAAGGNVRQPAAPAGAQRGDRVRRPLPAPGAAQSAAVRGQGRVLLGVAAGRPPVRQRRSDAGRRRQFSRPGGRVPGRSCGQGAYPDPARQPGRHHVQLPDRTDRSHVQHRAAPAVGNHGARRHGRRGPAAGAGGRQGFRADRLRCGGSARRPGCPGNASGPGHQRAGRVCHRRRSCRIDQARGGGGGRRRGRGLADPRLPGAPELSHAPTAGAQFGRSVRTLSVGDEVGR